MGSFDRALGSFSRSVDRTADYPIRQGAIESLLDPAIAELTRGATAAKTHSELRSRAGEILARLERAMERLPIRGMAQSELDGVRDILRNLSERKGEVTPTELLEAIGIAQRSGGQIIGAEAAAVIMLGDWIIEHSPDRAAAARTIRGGLANAMAARESSAPAFEILGAYQQQLAAEVLRNLASGSDLATAKLESSFGLVFEMYLQGFKGIVDPDVVPRHFDGRPIGAAIREDIRTELGPYAPRGSQGDAYERLDTSLIDRATAIRGVARALIQRSGVPQPVQEALSALVEGEIRATMAELRGKPLESSVVAP